MLRQYCGNTLKRMPPECRWITEGKGALVLKREEEIAERVWKMST